MAETLAYLDNYLKGFHDNKEVFLEFRQSKTSKRKAEAQDKQLRKRHAEEDVDGITLRNSMGSGSKSKWQCLEIARKEECKDQRLEIMERETHFNYPKMHLAMHFHDQVIRFDNLLMYSTEISESSYQT